MTKKIYLLMLLGIFMLGSCTNEMSDVQLPTVEDETQDALMSKTERLYAVKKPNRGGSGMAVPQAVAVIDKLWTHQDTIKIKFLMALRLLAQRLWNMEPNGWNTSTSVLNMWATTILPMLKSGLNMATVPTFHG